MLIEPKRKIVIVIISVIIRLIKPPVIITTWDIVKEVINCSTHENYITPCLKSISPACQIRNIHVEYIYDIF